MGGLLGTNALSPAFVPGAYEAMKQMLGNPDDAFFSGRIMDLLYDGISLDCSSDEMLVEIICDALQTANVARPADDNENHLLFSLFSGVS